MSDPLGNVPAMTPEPLNEAALELIGHGAYGNELAATMRRQALAKLPDDAPDEQRRSEAMHANMLATELLNERLS